MEKNVCLTRNQIVPINVQQQQPSAAKTSVVKVVCVTKLSEKGKLR